MHLDRANSLAKHRRQRKQLADHAARRALILWGETTRAEARAGLVYGPYLTADSRCSLTTAKGGACTKLRRRWARPRRQPPRYTRGKVLEFSRRSRTRLQQTLCAIPKDQVIRGMLFLTLTYPGAWSHDARVWKRDLDVFAKRLRRQYPPAAFVWKLEPQPKRKAPHYHLIVTGLRYIAKEWLSRAWFETVRSGDPKHLAAGTQVQLVQSHRGVISYAAKYTAKHQELPDDWQEPGRWWGVVNREGLGIEWIWVALSQPQFFAACRVLRSLIFHRGLGRCRAPPRPCHSGMWGVMTDVLAARLVGCVADRVRSVPSVERHAHNVHPLSSVDCRVCNPRGARPVGQAVPASQALSPSHGGHVARRSVGPDRHQTGVYGVAWPNGTIGEG